MTDEQIMKALECCENTKCDLPCAECPLQTTMNCNHALNRYALALIRRQRKEIRNLEYTLLGVMHSVDKWLDDDELEQDEVSRAITMREKTLSIVESLQDENAKARAKAIREFAERLYAKEDKAACSVSVYDISDIVKELTEEQI